MSIIYTDKKQIKQKCAMSKDRNDDVMLSEESKSGDVTSKIQEA
jgi:hypothetical protein